MTGSGDFYRHCKGGIEIFVRLTPKAARDSIDGIETAADGLMRLKARVRAVPEKGKANAALERLTATALGVPPSAVTVVAGTTARNKTVRVSGEVDAIEAALARCAG